MDISHDMFVQEDVMTHEQITGSFMSKANIKHTVTNKIITPKNILEKKTPLYVLTYCSRMYTISGCLVACSCGI